MLYYNLNGMPSKEPVEDKFWIADGAMGYTFKDNDLTYDFEEQAMYLRVLVGEKIFGSMQAYFELLPYATYGLSTAGIDSDIKIAHKDFELFLRDSNETTNKFLYYYDLINLIGALQNSVQEVKHLMGEFYKELNLNSFMLGPKPFEPDMLMFASGMIVTKIFTYVNHLFIALYSQLDFMAKICYEMEHIRTDFGKYEKLPGANIQIADKKRLSLNAVPGTLFEDTVNLRLIQSLRHEVVHNGSFENIQKVFQLFEKGLMVEKFIYLPDHHNGIIDSIKSRKRFFSQELKLNELLPELIFDFWSRLNTTVKLLVHL